MYRDYVRAEVDKCLAWDSDGASRSKFLLKFYTNKRHITYTFLSYTGEWTYKVKQCNELLVTLRANSNDKNWM